MMVELRLHCTEIVRIHLRHIKHIKHIKRFKNLYSVITELEGKAYVQNYQFGWIRFENKNVTKIL